MRVTVCNMNLRYRSFEPRDTAACLRLLEPYREYSPQVRAALPTFWKRLHDEQAMIGVVVEDCEPERTPAIVGFGADVAVTNEYMAVARAGCEPGLADRLIRHELHDKGSPILRRSAIGQANAGGGLNVIVVHAATPTSLPAESIRAIRFNMPQGFIWAHRGYRLKEVLREVWNDEREWDQAWGRLRSDFSDFYRKKGLSIPRERPYLYGITPEEALANAASVGATLFLYSPPRCQFSKRAQELLARAMEGETDVALARALHVSLSAVKMRWRAIYERVEAVAPDLLPTAASHVAESSRGIEKRRRIIEYVRSHPEELRPFAASTRQAPPRTASDAKLAFRAAGSNPAAPTK
jgi:hypothetical protein